MDSLRYTTLCKNRNIFELFSAPAKKSWLARLNKACNHRLLPGQSNAILNPVGESKPGSFLYQKLTMRKTWDIPLN